MQQGDILFKPLELPCGSILKNRIIKSAMSDSLGDGTGHPSPEQIKLYRRWAKGGLAASIIGEVQQGPDYAEKPGNLVLDENSNLDAFGQLAQAGRENGAQLWLQLGHAGALAYAPTSNPKGPSALDLPGLCCAEMSISEIRQVPARFANTARLGRQSGFTGVQIHAAHGFLLSQFLSPLFNKRQDDYGGSIVNRMRLLLQTITAVRAAVGDEFPVVIKLNSTDQLEGGLSQQDALQVVEALNATSIDLIDISGGTYFPGAKAASDTAGRGPYFLDFATRARARTTKPLMLTGGFKTHAQAIEALSDGAVDVVGLARALVLEPDLPQLWQNNQMPAPTFPRFKTNPEGGVTAWYTMRITEIATNGGLPVSANLDQAISDYETRDAERTRKWLQHFSADE